MICFENEYPQMGSPFKSVEENKVEGLQRLLNICNALDVPLDFFWFQKGVNA